MAVHAGLERNEYSLWDTEHDYPPTAKIDEICVSGHAMQSAMISRKRLKSSSQPTRTKGMLPRGEWLRIKLLHDSNSISLGELNYDRLDSPCVYTTPAVSYLSDEPGQTYSITLDPVVNSRYMLALIRGSFPHPKSPGLESNAQPKKPLTDHTESGILGEVEDGQLIREDGSVEPFSYQFTSLHLSIAQSGLMHARISPFTRHLYSM
jgi:hypothetical protein